MMSDNNLRGNPGVDNGKMDERGIFWDGEKRKMGGYRLRGGGGGAHGSGEIRGEGYKISTVSGE